MIHVTANLDFARGVAILKAASPDSDLSPIMGGVDRTLDVIDGVVAQDD